MNKKKIIILLVTIAIFVITYFVVTYLQFPLSPNFNIKYKNSTVKPAISYCSWRTNFYNTNEMDNYYKMLEGKDEIIVEKTGEIIEINTQKRIGLRTERYDSDDGIFIEMVKTEENQKINIPKGQAYDNLKVKVNPTDFNIEITLPTETGYYDYLIATYYNVGVCEYAFKIKVEDQLIN